MKLNTSRRVLVVYGWRRMVKPLTAGRISLRKNIGVTQSRLNETWFRSKCASFSLFKLYSLPLSLGRGLFKDRREPGQDTERERKSTLSHNVVLVFVLGKDDVQTTEWSAVVGGTMDTIQLTDIPYRLVDDPSGSSKT